MEIKSIKEKAKKKFEDVKINIKAIRKVIEDNPELKGKLVTGGFTAIGGLIWLLPGLFSKKEDQCRIDDSITGSYFRTTHPLTNDELCELTYRMLEENQTKAEALQRMGVLADERRRRN